MSRAPGLGVLAIVALIGSSCAGDVFSNQVPTQKSSSQLLLFPDFARAGDEFDVDVVIFTPDATSYITDFDFGPGLDVLSFNSSGDGSCSSAQADTVVTPDLFEQTQKLVICLYMVAQPDAPLGERSVSIDVESGSVPVVARGTFYLLPAPPATE